MIVMGLLYNILYLKIQDEYNIINILYLQKLFTFLFFFLPGKTT